MAIRVVNSVGVSDTEAELLAAASEYANNTVVYCTDTNSTFTKIGSSFINVEYYNITESTTIAKSIRKYYIDTRTIGSSVTITLPSSLIEGEPYLFKRADTGDGYDIIFTSTLLIDKSDDDLTFKANGNLNAISFVKQGNNFYII